MSAQSAPETPSTVNSLARDRVASLRTVQVPGSPATYANRAVLREVGLRWDPANHRWHGTTTTERVKELRERLGLEVRCFGDLEAPPKGPAAPKPAPPPGPARGPAPIVPAAPNHDAAHHPHDGLQTNLSGSSHPRSFVPGTRTRVEARIAFPGADEDAVEIIATTTRRFTLRESISGLPDDSREEDEREEARRLRDLRARVKTARALASITPGLATTLQNDRQKATRFYTRFGITQALFRLGVPSERESSQCDSTTELQLLDPTGGQE